MSLVDFVTTAEYRALLASRRDIPAVVRAMIVVTATADLVDEVAEPDVPAATGTRPRSAARRPTRRPSSQRSRSWRPRAADSSRQGRALEDARRPGRLLHHRRQEGHRRQPLQGSWRDEPGAALGNHDEPGGAHAAAGSCRGPHRGRPHVYDADGRSGRAAPASSSKTTRSTSRTWMSNAAASSAPSTVHPAAPRIMADQDSPSQHPRQHRRRDEALEWITP